MRRPASKKTKYKPLAAITSNWTINWLDFSSIATHDCRFELEKCIVTRAYKCLSVGNWTPIGHRNDRHCMNWYFYPWLLLLSLLMVFEIASEYYNWPFIFSGTSSVGRYALRVAQLCIEKCSSCSTRDRKKERKKEREGKGRVYHNSEKNPRTLVQRNRMCTGRMIWNAIVWLWISVAIYGVRVQSVAWPW